MSRDERIDLIRELERVRGSRVLCYLTADRGIASVPVAEDVVRRLYRHLRSVGRVPQLDLFISSRGGDTHVPWPLVVACRRFAERFTVLIPYRAHSAATLMGLGADELVFGPIGELTQVDPSIRTDFTPPSTQAGTNLLVAVEDLTAYFDFMRETVRIGPEDARAAVDLLREKLHPLAIGQAFRSGRSVEYVAQHLLMLHMGDQEKAARIARSLVTELHVHAHRITLEEAQELGLPARAASTEEDQAMWKLYEAYEAEMQLEQPLRPTTVFPNVSDSLVELKDLRMVYVESADAADFYSMDLVAVRTQSQQFPAGITYPGGQLQSLPTPQRPVWSGQVTFAVERESWSTE